MSLGPVGDKTVREAGSAAASAGPSYKKGSSILDTYKVVSGPIEAGGMGLVWHVHHTGWHVDLAMKQPRAEFFATEENRAIFTGECTKWASLGLHPNIVSCYYVREIDGIPTIFAEWMEGGSLADWMADGRLYREGAEAQGERILDIAIQFARGLHYAHELEDTNGEKIGMLHRDVKPGNLLLTKDGEAKVSDFGLAQARALLTMPEAAAQMPAEWTRRERTTFFASPLFTPAYCSMEQMDGKILTRQTDIYSWAVSVLEMYVGSHPWASGVVAGVDCRNYFTAARLPLPEQMKELLAACLESDMEKRPRDFGVVLEKLSAIYRAVTGGEYPRPEREAAISTADSLNNRALSYIDLGMRDRAKEIFAQILQRTPNHAAATYNSCLLSWVTGVFDDEKVLQILYNAAPGYAVLFRRAAGRSKYRIRDKDYIDDGACFDRYEDAQFADALTRERYRKNPKILRIMEKAISAHRNVEEGFVLNCTQEYLYSYNRFDGVKVWKVESGVCLISFKELRPIKVAASKTEPYVLYALVQEYYADEPEYYAVEHLSLQLYDYTKAIQWEICKIVPFHQAISDEQLYLEACGQAEKALESHNVQEALKQFTLAKRYIAWQRDMRILQLSARLNRLCEKKQIDQAYFKGLLYENSPENIIDLGISSDGKKAVCVSITGSLIFFDLIHFQCEHKLARVFTAKRISYAVNLIRFSKDNSAVVLSNIYDDVVCVNVKDYSFESFSGDFDRKYAFIKDKIKQFDFDENQRYRVCVSHEEKRAFLYDFEREKRVAEFETTVKPAYAKPCICEYAKLAAIATSSSEFGVFDTVSGELIFKKTYKPYVEKIYKFQFSSKGRYLFVGIENERIDVYDTKERASYRSIIAHNDGVIDFALSADDTTLITCAYRSVKVFYMIYSYDSPQGPFLRDSELNKRE